MSRKSQEDQSGWAMPSLYAFVGEYGPFKVKENKPIADTLVWLHNSGEPSEENRDNDRRHSMYPLAGPIQDLLVSDRKKEPRFSAVLVIDINDMFESYDEYKEALKEETEKTDLTKKFGKKLLRLFQKLLVYRVSVAARGGDLCSLLLKLYKALEQIDSSNRLEENNTIAELWLLYPDDLSAKYINTHFKAEKDGSAAKKYPVEFNVVHKTSSSDNKHRIWALKEFFPVAGTLLAMDEDEVNDLLSIVARRKDRKRPLEDKYSSSKSNNMGKMLFMSRMKVEMNPISKQYERNCTEATSDLLKITAAKIEAVAGGRGGAVVGADGTIDWSSCERYVGGLLLRGNRCVLVRSLDDEWDGMRIPSMAPEPGESPHDTAIRAVSELAEVDETEMRPLPHVLPVSVYDVDPDEGGEAVLVELYPLYAVNPPPEGSVNAPDEEDEEDPYDWYRFPAAVARLDKASVAGLHSMAFHLLQASRVGLVPAKWGGVFGQELQLEDKIATLCG